MRTSALVLALLLLTAVTLRLHAEDWPEFRGAGRAGGWNESGIIDRFPAGGLQVLWRTPVREGYSSPVVSNGRVFLMDFTRTKGNTGPERAVALDEKTGKVLWTVEWEANYGGFVWPNGPRATPTVDGNAVYTLGARGILHALNVRNGEVLWKKDLAAEYKATGAGGTGFASPPVVHGNLLIAVVGADPDGMVMAFDKLTGKETWRALETKEDPGTAQPIIVNEGGTAQLIIWTQQSVTSLDPSTGKVFWTLPWKASMMNIPVPVVTGHRLLLSNFYTGSMLAQLDQQKPAAAMVWKGNSESEISTDGLHAVIGTPLIIGDYIYGFCSYGQLRALNAKTGERIWETQVATKERARWASAHMIRHGDRVFISNDRGELILAKLSPEGYQEIDRINLLKPTSPPGIRRQLDAVTVVHPAYANRHIYMRNDEEIVAFSLSASDYVSVAPVESSSARPSAAPAPVARVGGDPRPAAGARAVEIQYIPSLSGAKKANERDAEYSSLYMLLNGGPHSLAFSSDNGVVLVNSKQAGWAKAIQDKLPEITLLPVSTIINTHPGADYTGSNEGFTGSVTIVAHEKTRDAMAKMPAFQGANSRFLPNKTFTDRLTLFGGKNRVDLYHFGAAHTAGDAIVAIPISNLAYLGELLPSRSVPVIDTANGGSALAFADTLARALETLKTLDIQFVVSGRAEPRRGRQIEVLTMKDLQEYIEFNRELRAAVRGAAEAGKTVDEATAAVTLPNYKNYDMRNLKTYVQALYGELKK